MVAERQGASPYQPSEQLTRLQSWCRDAAPAFYRDHAQYLRQLRQQLPEAVHRALATLLCEIDQDLLNRLTPQARSGLQSRIDQLVTRSLSFLTIEQLQLLARDMDRDRHRRRQRSQQVLVDALQRTDPDGTNAPSTSDPSNESDGSHPAHAVPMRSVDLSLAPPIEQPDLLDGLLSAMASPDASSQSSSPSEPPQDSSVPEVELAFTPDPESPGEDNDDSSEQASPELVMLQSLFAMAGDSFVNEPDAAGVEPIGSESVSEVTPQAPGASESSEFMPGMPEPLQHWLDGLDRALARRLRNLSHAINVELLRAGLTSSLLPNTLLEAVLKSQVETLPAPSNLLRLKLPVPLGGDAEPMLDVSCVLLRASDLEFDLPSLRRCRYRLRQRRRNLLTMVQQQRHWQRRAQTQQVQQQWWPSPPETPPPI